MALPTGITMTLDWNTLITQAPFFGGMLYYMFWLTKSFLKWLEKDRSEQAEEREVLYKVVNDSAKVQAEALTALTSQCARAQKKD